MTARKAWRTPVAAALLLLAACGGAALKLPAQPRGKVVLEVRGDFKGSPRALGADDVAALPKVAVKGTDPVTGRAAEWEGADLSVIVKNVAEVRPGVDTVVVRTAAGEAVPINLGKFVQYRPALATRADGAALDEPRLAWPNGEQPGLLRDPRHRAWWAEKPVAIEVVRWPRVYGRALSLPGGQPAEARRGGGLFVERCVSCHAMRGAGGTRGPELTAWAEAHDGTALSAKLAKHPGRLPGDLEQDFVAPLQAYLTSMTKAGPLPPLPAEDKDGKPAKPPEEDEGEGGRRGGRRGG
ncbi:MAG: hypothetical protein QM704_19105 [Anaeromyxobacteraceae bacterium]